MSLFRCVACGCVENTACCLFWVGHYKDKQWKCSECEPLIGKWHGKFEKKSVDGYYFDENGFIYPPAGVDAEKMELIYNRNFKMVGRY